MQVPEIFGSKDANYSCYSGTGREPDPSFKMARPDGVFQLMLFDFHQNAHDYSDILIEERAYIYSGDITILPHH
jgi:hypothetical protein